MAAAVSTAAGVIASRAACVRLITFDFSGTLGRIRGLGPGEHYAKAVREIAGVELDPVLTNTCFKDAYKAAERIWPNFGADAEGFTNNKWWHLVIQRTLLDTVYLSDVDEALRRHMRERVTATEPRIAEVLLERFASSECYETFAETPAVLETLRTDPATRHIALRVVSNFPETLRRLLASLGIAHFFDVVVVSREERVSKPSPALIQRAMGQIQPLQTLHVGDNAVDVRAGIDAGLLGCVLLERDGVGRVDAALRGQAMVVSSLEGLLPVLGVIWPRFVPRACTPTLEHD